MNKLKFLMILALALVISYNITSAQMMHNMPGAEERSNKLTERLKEELKLDEKQTPKVKEILLKYAKKLDSLKTNSQDPSSMMESMKKNMVAQDKDIKSVLTKEQFQKYEKIMEENRNRMRRRN